MNKIIGFSQRMATVRMIEPMTLAALRAGGGIVVDDLPRIPTYGLRRPPGADTRWTAIYFLEAEGLGRVKIGRAHNIETRMTELQCACPAPLRLLWAYAAPGEHEYELHARFRRLRIIGEWFALESALSAYIAQRKPGLYRASRSRKKAA